MYTLPNLITLTRIALGFLFFTYYPNPSSYIFIYLGAFSDILDGWVARRFNLTSKLGEVLDPIVDKIFWILIVIKLYTSHVIPKWFLISVGIRDTIFFVAFIYMFITNNYKFKATASGKITATIVGLSCISTLYEMHPITHFLYYISILMMTYNAFDYLNRVKK